MANSKNEAGKPAADKQTGTSAGASTGSGGKVSAGSSVGNIGEAPMPQAHDKTAQGSSSTSGGQGRDNSTGQGTQGAQGSAQGSQGSQGSQGGMADKAQQATDQVRQRASETYEGASDWARDAYGRAGGWASGAYRQQRRYMGRVRGGVQGYVSENPMAVGLVGLAAGLLLGALLPRTRRENEFFGEWADEVRNQGLRYAREAAERGRGYVEEAFTGDDAQFSRHDSEFEPNRPDINRH